MAASGARPPSGVSERWEPAAGERLPDETPRTWYNKQRRNLNRLTLGLIMTLDADQIHRIRARFFEHEDASVNLAQFVRIMREVVRERELGCTQDELVASLMDLFDYMDLDGNHSLEFDEFLETIVHMGMGKAQSLTLNPIKEYHEGPVFHTSRHVTEQSVAFVPEIDRVLLTDTVNRTVKLCEPTTFHVTSRISLGRSAPLCAAYVHSNLHREIYGYLVTATTQFLQVWEGANGECKLALRDEVITRHPQSALRWVPEHNMLYSGDTSGDVRCWRLSLPSLRPDNSSDEQRKTKEVRKFSGHRDVVTCLESAGGMDTLITGSLDSTVRLWDVSKGVEKFQLRGHRAGVIGVSYSEEFRFLFSAGIDHDVCVWSPFSDKLILKLTGHAAPLIGVQCVRGTPQVVSMDAEGWLKVWDMRNFSCVQTCMTLSSVSSFTTCGEKQKRVLVAGSKEVATFPQDGGPYSKVSDVDSVFMCVYNKALLSFASAGRREVRVWNALTGRLAHVFRDMCEQEITALCLDHRDRKLIVGDQGGNISVFNYQTGAFMKSLTAHDGEVLSVSYCVETQTVISAGRDRLIRVHDETPIEEKKVVTAVNVPSGEITATSFSFDMSLIVAASSTQCNVHVWDMESGKLEALCRGHQQIVSALCFLGQHPLFASADDGGHVLIWSTRAGMSSYQCVLRFHNTASDHEADSSGVLAMCFERESETLCTGDEHGLVKLWSLHDALVHIGSRPVHLSASDAKAFQTGRRASMLSMYGRTTGLGARLGDGSQQRELAALRPTRIIDVGPQPVRHLALVDAPRALIVSNLSSRVRIYSLDDGAALLGELDLCANQRKRSAVGRRGHGSAADAGQTGAAPAGEPRSGAAAERSPRLAADATVQPPWLFRVDVQGLHRRDESAMREVLLQVEAESEAPDMKEVDSTGAPQRRTSSANDTGKSPKAQVSAAIIAGPAGVESRTQEPELVLALRMRALEQEMHLQRLGGAPRQRRDSVLQPIAVRTGRFLLSKNDSSMRLDAIHDAEAKRLQDEEKASHRAVRQARRTNALRQLRLPAELQAQIDRFRERRLSTIASEPVLGLGAGRIPSAAPQTTSNDERTQSTAALLSKAERAPVGGADAGSAPHFLEERGSRTRPGNIRSRMESRARSKMQAIDRALKGRLKDRTWEAATRLSAALLRLDCDDTVK